MVLHNVVHSLFLGVEQLLDWNVWILWRALGEGRFLVGLELITHCVKYLLVPWLVKLLGHGVIGERGSNLWYRVFFGLVGRWLCLCLVIIAKGRWGVAPHVWDRIVDVELYRGNINPFRASYLKRWLYFSIPLVVRQGWLSIKLIEVGDFGHLVHWLVTPPRHLYLRTAVVIHLPASSGRRLAPCFVSSFLTSTLEHHSRRIWNHFNFFNLFTPLARPLRIVFNKGSKLSITCRHCNWCSHINF